MTKSSNKGFTLIELLVVIAIIGLLSTLAVVALNSARAKSRDSKRVADVKQMQTALELFFADNNGYPVQATAITLGGANGTLTNVATGFNGTAGSTTYMGLVPSAPTPADTTTCSTAVAGVTPNDYRYSSAAAGSNGFAPTYQITFCLGAKTGDLLAGTHTATQDGIR